MAEIIGLVGLAASVAQLVQMGIQISILFKDLNSKLKNGPVSAACQLADIEQLVEIVKSIRQDHPDAGRLSDLVDRCRDDASLLLELLNTMCLDVTQKGLRRRIGNFRKAVSWKSRETELVQICTKLERKRNNLQLELNSRTFEGVMNIQQKFEKLNFCSTPSQNDVLGHSPYNRRFSDSCRVLGRNDLLDDLASKLEKTDRHTKRSPLTRIFWLRCDTESRFIHDYCGIATHVNLPDVDKVSGSQPINGIKSWLSSSLSGRWIIVMDNVNEEILKRNLLALIPPNPNGSVILTTRNKTIAEETASTAGNIFEVKALKPEDAKIVLLDIINVKELCPVEDAFVTELIRRLAYHPLAISYAGCYIYHKAISVSRYIDLFETTSELVPYSQRIVEPGQRNNLNPSGLIPVAVTLMISFDEIQRLNPFSADILSLMGCLASQNIPRCLLTLGCKDEDSMELNAALELLKKYSFITGDSQDQYFDIPDTVYLQIRERPHPNHSLKQWMKSSISAILRYFPADPSLEASNLEMCDSLLPHAEAILNYPCADVEIEAIRLDLAYCCCHYLQLKGCQNQALRLAKDAASRAESSFGKDYPKTFTIQAQLAILLRETGDLVQAREFNERIVAGRSRTLGEDHPDTLCSLNSLALVMQSQGYYDKAEAMHRLVLERRQRVLGLGDAQTLRSMHNLAFCLQMQLQYDAAEAIGRRVVSLKTELLGHDSIDTASSISNLAIVLQELGKLESAMELHQKVLKVREGFLGKHHPLVLQTRNNIAGVWYRRRHFIAAEKEISQVLALNVEIRGHLHPESLTCIANLSALLEATGKHQEAEKLAREALQGREEVFGIHHPITVESRQALQRLEKALKPDSAGNV